jgi:hypothetical protein
MRIAKVITVMFFGPALGILVGFAVGVVAMPSQAPDGGRAPGDGFLIMGCVVISFLLSIPVSAALAGKLWSNSSKKSD